MKTRGCIGVSSGERVEVRFGALYVQGEGEMANSEFWIPDSWGRRDGGQCLQLAVENAFPRFEPLSGALWQCGCYEKRTKLDHACPAKTMLGKRGTR